jgi:DNA-binding NarL/FixJ family response regulator
MIMTLGQTIRSPILVGRQPFVELLARYIEAVRHVNGQVAILTGEAGIGKSRLVAEARRLATASGWQVLQGYCFEQDRALPYAPLLDLLHDLTMRRAPGGPTGVRPDGTAALERAIEALTTPAIAGEGREGLAQRRHRHEELAGLLVDLASAQPCLLIFEDLHWADDNSLEFLHLLAWRAQGQPLMVMLTARPDEAPEALRDLTDELVRRRLALEMPLTRLSPVEVEAMVSAIFAQTQPVQTEFLEPLHGLTEGNPFFVEEVLKSLVAAGEIYFGPSGWTRKPVSELTGLRVHSLQDLVARRTRQLSQPAQDLLALAAVAGRRFEFDVLQHVTGITEAELLTLLRELLAAQLVVEEAPDQFAFRHALTQHTIYTGLLARERRTRHAQIASTLEAVLAGQLEAHLPDLAYHALEGHLWDKALAYSEAAGDRTLAVYAPRAAVEHYTHALRAAENLGRTDRAGLWRKRARAQQLIGVFEPVRDDLAAALAAARTAGDRHLEWELLLELGLLWSSRDYAQTEAYLRQALELAQALEAPSALGHSLNRLGNYLTNVERPQEALAYQQQALARFESLGDQHGLAESHDLIATSLLTLGDWVVGPDHHRQAAALFKTLDQRQGLASSLTMGAMRAGAYLNDTTVTPLAEADGWRDAEIALDLARQTGQQAAEALAGSVLAFCLGPRGEYARALPLAQAGHGLAEEIGHQHWITFGNLALGALHLDLLALPSARTHLERALELARAIGSRFFETMGTAFLVSTCVQQDDLPGALAVFEAAYLSWPPSSGMQRQAWAARAELALAEADAQHALQITTVLLETALNLGAHDTIPRLDWLRGQALAVLGQPARAVSVLTTAAEAAQRHGWRALHWRILASLSEVELALGHRAQAHEALTAARGILAELAEQVPDSGLRETFMKQAGASLPTVGRPTQRQSAKHEYGGLTAREREVAGLIVQGKTNRAIAETMVLSERTVAKHVENILSKLGFESRAQIAVWAAERRLAPPTPPPAS